MTEQEAAEFAAELANAHADYEVPKLRDEWMARQAKAKAEAAAYRAGEAAEAAELTARSAEATRRLALRIAAAVHASALPTPEACTLSTDAWNAYYAAEAAASWAALHAGFATDWSAKASAQHQGDN